MSLEMATGVLKDDILFEGRSDYQDILVFKYVRSDDKNDSLELCFVFSSARVFLLV